MDSQDVSHSVQVLKHNKNLHSSHLQGFEGVLHAIAVLPCVLADLIKIPPFRGNKQECEKSNTTIPPSPLLEQLIVMALLPVTKVILCDKNLNLKLSREDGDMRAKGKEHPS